MLRPNRLQFRLSTLVVAFVAISLAFGLLARRAEGYRRQAVLIRELELSGLTIVREPGAPRWLGFCCDAGTFFDAKVVGVSGSCLSALQRLSGLPRLRSIYIEDARVTADDLSFLAACKSLECIGFCRVILRSGSIEALAAATQLDVAIFDSCDFDERFSVDLPRLGHLKMVKVVNMDVGQDARERIGRLLPGVNVSIERK